MMDWIPKSRGRNQNERRKMKTQQLTRERYDPRNQIQNFFKFPREKRRKRRRSSANWGGSLGDRNSTIFHHPSCVTSSLILRKLALPPCSGAHNTLDFAFRLDPLGLFCCAQLRSHKAGMRGEKIQAKKIRILNTRGRREG